MKPKNVLLVVVLLGLTSLLVIIFGGGQQTSIQTIVTETHKQINKNLKLFKDNLNDLKDAYKKRLITDKKFLTLLGFEKKPRLYPHAVWTNTTLPIVVTYVLETDHEKQAIGLLRNVHQHLPNTTLVVYDLGVSHHALHKLQAYCDGSRYRCVLLTFDLSIFPSHVGEVVVHAFRPLIIQDALNRAGAILFLENDQRFTNSQLSPLLKCAIGSLSHPGSGVVAWATRQATSSVTHPNMFDYFHTSAEHFLFLPMVEVTKLLLYNTADVHHNLMLPWVQCALSQDCIFPIGAQSGGCHFNKKPQYRYSGCHGYDASALNIVLGLHFDFDATRYTFNHGVSKKNFNLFRTVSGEGAIAEFNALEEEASNVTGYS